MNKNKKSDTKRMMKTRTGSRTEPPCPKYQSNGKSYLKYLTLRAESLIRVQTTDSLMVQGARKKGPQPLASPGPFFERAVVHWLSARDTGYRYR